MAVEPGHRSEYTGNALLDRIQSNVRDLITFVRTLTWMRQRTYVALGTDTTIALTSPLTYVTLISATLTTVVKESYLLAIVSISGQKTTGAGTVYVRVLVDGAVAKGTYVTATASSFFAAPMIIRAAVSAGQHTIELQWATDVSSVRVNASSVVNEHAAMQVTEEYYG